MKWYVSTFLMFGSLYADECCNEDEIVMIDEDEEVDEGRPRRRIQFSPEEEEMMEKRTESFWPSKREDPLLDELTR